MAWEEGECLEREMAGRMGGGGWEDRLEREWLGQEEWVEDERGGWRERVREEMKGSGWSG